MKNNVILLVADQLRHDVLGKGYTPNIDKLCSESVSFTNAYCSAPLCVPSRGSIFTGVYPSRNGCRINPWDARDGSAGRVKKEFDNLYDLMERTDYECIHSGKQHFIVEGENIHVRKDSKIKWATTGETYRKFLKENGKRVPGGKRFSTLCPEMTSGKYTKVKRYSNGNTGHYEEGYDYYFDGYFTNGVIDALNKRDKNKPLYLSMMFLAPHPPLDIPSPYYEKGESYNPDIPLNVAEFYPHQSPLQAYNLPGVIGMGRTYEEWVQSWKIYLGLVNLLDDCVGQIIQNLKDDGIYDDSIILFSSDHGEMLGSHSLFQKMCMYEESSKVPFNLKLPNSKNAGMVIENTISHVDLLPTLCDMLDLKINHKMDGESLKGLLYTETDKSRNEAYVQFDGNGALGNFQRCVVDGNFKFIMDIFKDETYYELYDIKNDKLETTNLIFENGYMQKAKDCLAKLLKHMEEVGDEISPTNIDLDGFIKNY